GGAPPLQPGGRQAGGREARGAAMARGAGLVPRDQEARRFGGRRRGGGRRGLSGPGRRRRGPTPDRRQFMTGGASVTSIEPSSTSNAGAIGSERAPALPGGPKKPFFSREARRGGGAWGAGAPRSVSDPPPPRP